MPDVFGPIYPGSPSVVRFQGMLNAAGTKTKSFAISDTGIDFIPLYSQAYYFDSGLGFYASNPRFVSLLGGTIP